MKTVALKKWIVIGFTAAGCGLFCLLLWINQADRSAWRDFNRGKLLLKENNDNKEGWGLIEAAASQLSCNPDFLESYGWFLAENDRKREAAAIYEKALSLRHSPHLLERMSLLYLQLGELKRARARAEQELIILPWKLTPRYVLAAVHAELGNREEAFARALDTILTPMKVSTRRGMRLKKDARKILAESVQGKPDLGKTLEGRLEGILTPETRHRLQVALAVSGNNRNEILDSLTDASNEHLPAMVFLLTNMPEQDLRNLDADYLLHNCALAFQVRSIWPFRERIPEEVFLNYLLPYSQAGENRDNWRKGFLEEYFPVVEECKSVGEILLSLQAWIPIKENLKFDHENRADSFWSVSETLENKLGDCINFSILLANACRAVGVPARLAAIPSWVGVQGGHAWVEVYDQGRWRHISAFDPSPLDQTWFEERVASTDPSRFRHRVYGASFRRTNIQLQLYGPNVWWTDETERYVDTRQSKPGTR